MSSLRGLTMASMGLAPTAEGLEPESGEDDSSENERGSKEKNSKAGSETEDDISLSEDSVYIRMTEHGTPRLIEEVYRRHEGAQLMAQDRSVNKQFFTGHARTTNEEIYFRRDVTTPAVLGALKVSANMAVEAININARQPPCSNMTKLGAHVAVGQDSGSGPGTSGEEDVDSTIVDDNMKLEMLQRTHNAVETEKLRLSHEPGAGQDQRLPPRPVEALALMESIVPTPLQEMATPKLHLVSLPMDSNAYARSPPKPSSSSLYVQVRPPSSSAPSNSRPGSSSVLHRNRLSKDASFSMLEEAPQVPQVPLPAHTHVHAHTSVKPQSTVVSPTAATASCSSSSNTSSNIGQQDPSITISARCRGRAHTNGADEVSLEMGTPKQRALLLMQYMPSPMRFGALSATDASCDDMRVRPSTTGPGVSRKQRTEQLNNNHLSFGQRKGRPNSAPGNASMLAKNTETLISKADNPTEFTMPLAPNVKFTAGSRRGSTMSPTFNSVYIHSLIHGKDLQKALQVLVTHSTKYTHKNDIGTDSDEDENERTDWDEDGRICGNKPWSNTTTDRREIMKNRNSYWKRRRGIMGPRVNSAEENMRIAIARQKEIDNFGKPVPPIQRSKRQTFIQHLLFNRQIDNASKALHIDVNDKNQMLSIFDDIDIDKSGSIDKQELFQALNKAGMNPTQFQLDAFFRVADVDENGDIDREEWVNALTHKKDWKAQQAQEQKENNETNNDTDDDTDNDENNDENNNNNNSNDSNNKNRRGSVFNLKKGQVEHHHAHEVYDVDTKIQEEMNARLKFREEYARYKASISDVTNMKPFAWMNRAHSDNHSLGLKESGKKISTSTHGGGKGRPESLYKKKGGKVKFTNNTLSFGFGFEKKKEIEEKNKPEIVLHINHGKFSDFEDSHLNNIGFNETQCLKKRESAISDDSIDSVKGAATLMTTDIRVYDSYYEDLYSGVLKQLLLHHQPHKFNSNKTNILHKLDGPHQLEGYSKPSTALNDLGMLDPKKRKLFPGATSPSQVKQQQQQQQHTAIDEKQKLIKKLTLLEREVHFPVTPSKNEKNVISIDANGPAPFLAAALPVIGRNEVFAISKDIITRGQEQLASDIGMSEVDAQPQSSGVAGLLGGIRCPFGSSTTTKPRPPILPPGKKMPVLRAAKKRRWNKFSFISSEIKGSDGLDMAALMECLLQSHQSDKKGGNVSDRENNHDGDGGNINNLNIKNLPSMTNKVRPNVSFLSSELVQLFTGFNKLDYNGDGLLSSTDLSEFVDDHEAKAQLPSHLLNDLIFGVDDAQRGAITFDEVQSYYLRLRPQLDEQLRLWKEADKATAESKLLADKRSRNNNGSNRSSKHIVVRPGQVPAAAAVVAVPPSLDKSNKEHGGLSDAVRLPFLPLLLYRLLIFASLLGENDHVELMESFRVFVEQYGASVAEKAFELVFLRPVAGLLSTDTLRLSAFVKHVRANSVEKTFRASIFEPPVVRESIPPSEQRRRAKTSVPTTATVTVVEPIKPSIKQKLLNKV